MRRDMRRRICALLALVLTWTVAGRAHAQAVDDGSSLRIYLMTVEPGSEIWEKFGHDALWIIDSATGERVSYNYGIFDFAQPHFIPNFLRGRMLYSMGEAPRSVDAELAYYASFNRTIVVQELNLTPAQKRDLRDFLAWNNLPENTSYRYDYFRDNCATRIRDAIDRATGGQLRSALTARDAGTTYRWQARRMMAAEVPVGTFDVGPLAYTGIELGLGNPVDHPLNAWDDSFLPMQLMEHVRHVDVRGPDGADAPLVLEERVLYQSDRAPVAAEPPNRTGVHLLIGLIIGGILLAAGWLAASYRAARVAFGVVGFLWSLVAGVFGLIIMLLWAVTDHTATYRNENVLQLNVLSLVLAVLVLTALFGRARRTAFRVAAAVAGLAVLGFVLQIMPEFDQFNGEIIALALPAHLGLLGGMVYLTGYKVSSRRDGLGAEPAVRV